MSMSTSFTSSHYKIPWLEEPTCLWMEMGSAIVWLVEKGAEADSRGKFCEEVGRLLQCCSIAPMVARSRMVVGVVLVTQPLESQLRTCLSLTPEPGGCGENRGWRRQLSQVPGDDVTWSAKTNGCVQ